MRFVLALLFMMRLAHADVGIVVAGDPNMQARVVDHAQRWLQDKKYELVAAPLGDSTTSFVDCFVMDDMGCAKKAFNEKSSTSTVVFIRVDMQTAQSRDYKLTAYWFVKGAEPVSEKRTCTQCDDTALGATVDGLMADLSAKGARGKGTIKIASSGTELLVRIDGNEVGSVPVEHKVDAGSHELVFIHEGAPVDVRRIEVDAGKTIEINAPHVVERPNAVSGGGRSRLVPGLLVTSGLLAAAAGGVLLYYGSLRGPDEPYVYTHATEIGLPLALAGAFAVGAGTSLFFAGSGSDAKVGVSGTF